MRIHSRSPAPLPDDYPSTVDCQPTRPGRRRRLGVAAAAVLGAAAITGGAPGSAAAAPVRAAAPMRAAVGGPAAAVAPAGNLAEALQKALYFYDAEKSGPSRSTGHQPLEWRGDSEPGDAAVPLTTATGTNPGTNLPAAFISQYRSVLDPDGNGTVDLSGGYHDAGDHVKFGLPQAYAAATLGWGLVEFRDAYVATRTYDHAQEILRWFSDYFLRSTFRDTAGEVVAFAYMVGRGGVDHTYWGPPELQDPAAYPRQATFASATAPASDQAAGTAAALAIEYLNTRDTDPAYAARCLDTARALYRFAVRYRGTGNGDGFYPSSYDEDELSWAAAWLYSATGTAAYLTDITAQDTTGRYTGYLKRIINAPGDNWQNIWVHSWDTVWGGVFARLAPITNDARHWYFFRWNAEYWSGGAARHEDPADANYLKPTPAGYAMINTWGSARYNTAAQLCALVYRKHAPASAAAKATALSDWAMGQLNYLTGSNPLNRSYLVGYGTNPAQHPHHRAAHGSLSNNMNDPAVHRHTLWGALVGGPDGSDRHTDVTTDFVGNEVAIDYNAGLVGALAGLFTYYGAGQAVGTWTPPAEPAVTAYYAQAKLEQENNQRTQVTLRVNQFDTHPPHLEANLSLRYFFSIAELTAHGQDIGAVRVEVYYDESAVRYGAPARVSAPIAWDAGRGIYYLQVDWGAAAISGTRELQFGLIAGMDSTWHTWWDPSNDWSRTGLATGYADTPHIPLYRNGVRAYGEEPPRPA